MTEIGEAVAAFFGFTKSDKDPEPTITAQWSRDWVRVVHNHNWPPASPPTDDTIPPSATVRLHVRTTLVPDGTKASITIHRCDDGKMVKDGKIENLQVMANIVRDKNGNLPLFNFEAKHLPWDPWDTPFFFFKAEVSHKGLKTQTSKDYRGKPEETLRVQYHHAVVSDAIADTPAGGNLTTGAEMAEIAGYLRKRDHQAYTKAFNQKKVPIALWGSVVRNTYAYHHASHGDVVHKVTGASLSVPDNPHRAPW